MSRHPMFASSYPPANSIYVSEGFDRDVSLLLCHGWSRYEIWERLADTEALEPDSKPRIDAIATEYQARVPSNSPQFEALRVQVPGVLARSGVFLNCGQGWDAHEASEFAHSRAKKLGHWGYAYAHEQDIDRVIHTGILFFGFHSVDGESSLAWRVGEVVTRSLAALGFHPQWSGQAEERIRCENVRYEAALR